MEYSYGTSYGYDEFQVSPLLNNYDAPHMQMHKMFMDQPYRKAATGAYEAPPFNPPPPPPRPPQDTSQIPQSFTAGGGPQLPSAAPTMMAPQSDINVAIMVFVVALVMVIASSMGA